MKKHLPKKSQRIKPIINQLKVLVNKHYGDRLKYMILYGSYARGTYNSESDIDIMLVLNEMQSPYKEIDTLTDIKTDLMLENEIFISTNPTTTELFENSQQLFYKNVRREGVILWIPAKMLDKRIKADYEIGFKADEEEAKFALSEANMFYNTINEFITKLS